jgi:hypothetical protein
MDGSPDGPMDSYPIGGSHSNKYRAGETENHNPRRGRFVVMRPECGVAAILLFLLLISITIRCSQGAAIYSPAMRSLFASGIA